MFDPVAGAIRHVTKPAALTRAGILVVEHKGANRIYRVRGPRIARILALIEEFCTVHELYGLAAETESAEKEKTA